MLMANNKPHCLHNICLNDLKNQVLSKKNKATYKLVRPPKGNRYHDLFKHVLQVESSIKIYFDEMYVYQNYIVVFYLNKAKALIDLKPNIYNKIDLKKGIEFFILKNGNQGLKQIKGDSNSIYLYPNKGIALIDNDNNDTVDMLIIY